MKRARLVCSLVGIAAIGASAIANAANEPWYGANAGVFFPSNAAMREAMGDQWLSVGLSQVQQNRYERVHSMFDWNVLSNDNRGNHVFILTPSMGVIAPLTGKVGEARTYVALRVGASYVDYSIADSMGVVADGKRFGLNGNAEFGVQIGERLNLSVRYDVFNKMDGLTFDGTTIVLKYGLARF